MFDQEEEEDDEASDPMVKNGSRRPPRSSFMGRNLAKISPANTLKSGFDINTSISKSSFDTKTTKSRLDINTSMALENITLSLPLGRVVQVDNIKTRVTGYDPVGIGLVPTGS